MEVLHTLGLCLLVFRVLPRLDMLRALIVLASIYTVPALLKTVFEGREPNTWAARKCSVFVLNVGTFLIQVASIVCCLLFQIPMTSEEKIALNSQVLQEDVSPVVPRPSLKDGYFSDNNMYELPLALLLLSLAFWENFVDDDIELCGRVLAFRSWKKQLHHARGRLYIIVSVWKTLWVIAFAVLLQPGFNFNLQYSSGIDVTGGNPVLAPNMSTKFSVNNSVNGGLKSLEKRSLYRQSLFKREIEGTVSEQPPFTSTTTQASTLQPSTTTTPSGQDNNTMSLSDLFKLSTQTIKHFELYGVVYIQIISSSFVTYFGSTACKLCMQMVGFSLPLVLVLPATAGVIMLQSIFRFLQTGVFVWVGVETDSSTWVLHLAWLAVVWLSEIFIVSHIWFPENGRMERIERCGHAPILQ